MIELQSENVNDNEISLSSITLRSSRIGETLVEFW